MSEHAGVVRDGPGLAAAAALLAAPAAGAGPGPAGWTLATMAQLGTVLTAMAGRRLESRGAHWRADAPATDPAWAVRQTAARAADGDLVLASLPLGAGAR
jgi:aspartate oxidase